MMKLNLSVCFLFFSALQASAATQMNWECQSRSSQNRATVRLDLGRGGVATYHFEWAEGENLRSDGFAIFSSSISGGYQFLVESSSLSVRMDYDGVSGAMLVERAAGGLEEFNCRVDVQQYGDGGHCPHGVCGGGSPALRPAPISGGHCNRHGVCG